VSNPLLSIAIPAYDRPRELLYGLERFIRQIEGRFEDEVEVRVSDDCSPDDSLAVVQELCEQHAFLHFRRYDENVGLERNLIKCTEGCRGEYLWIFGDDDFLETADALETVVGHLKTGEIDVLVLNRTRRNFSLDRLLWDNWMNLDEKRVLHFDGLAELCLSFGFISVIGFVSVNVFKRELFTEVDFGDYWGTMYPQLGGMLEAFHSRPVRLLGNPIVCHRTQTAEEKKAALGEKEGESDFMSDIDQRNAIYFSHPYVKMLTALLDKRAFSPEDIVRIDENTVINGKLVDFLIHTVNLSREMGLCHDRNGWTNTIAFFDRLPLSSSQIDAANLAFGEWRNAANCRTI